MSTTPKRTAFSYFLQKEANIEGEFPYQSLKRTGTIELPNAMPFEVLIEDIKSFLLDNATEAFTGLAFANDYDEIIVELNPNN